MRPMILPRMDSTTPRHAGDACHHARVQRTSQCDLVRPPEVAPYAVAVKVYPVRFCPSCVAGPMGAARRGGLALRRRQRWYLV